MNQQYLEGLVTAANIIIQEVINAARLNNLAYIETQAISIFEQLEDLRIDLCEPQLEETIEYDDE
jgi:type IV secretory pathway VirB6-like protein